MSVTGQPPGVTATLDPGSLSSGQSATLSVSLDLSAAPGIYTLTITGSGASALKEIS